MAKNERKIDPIPEQFESFDAQLLKPAALEELRLFTPLDKSSLKEV
jgi:hypothetical protein